MREQLGIEPGRDGYLRWLLRMGDYKNILKIDTGLGNDEEYDKYAKKVAERTQLPQEPVTASHKRLQERRLNSG